MNSKSSFANLLNTVDKMSTTIKSDDTFWKLEQDKTGSGQAVIRFLPEREGSAPFVRIYTHGFKSPTGKWLIDNCPTTINQPCPICEANSILWNEGSEASKTLARERKRKLSYIANILVISDPKNPANEGKVFKFKFGKKIFDMIVDKIKPAFEGEEPMNPFDPYTGADFNIRIQKKDGWPSYDKSTFKSPKAIGSDDMIESLISQLHNIDNDVAPSQFKSESELRKKLDMVLGNTQPTRQTVSADDQPTYVAPPEVKTEKKIRPMPIISSDDDDDSAYFAALAAS